jgi:triphosphoribosyl-dephospho-CoA synthase
MASARANGIGKIIFPGGTGKTNFPEAIANLAHADAISASRVRKALAEGSFAKAAALCPETTWPYLLAALAERALRMELELPLKPGLVCPDSCGAHKDMDYALMLKGISAIRPFFPQMAVAASADELRQLGIDAEKAMLAATGGVNTHRGAIFALGLALNAANREMEAPATEELMQNRLGEIAQTVLSKQLTDNQFHSTLMGARRIAATGYKELFEDWLPYYRALRGKEGFSVASALSFAEEKPSFPLQMVLLRIMSTLDDTCIVKRVGKERADEVKKEAAALLQVIPDQAGDDERLAGHLEKMCAQYAAEGISPGGAADMLALTIFIDSIIV